MTNPLLTLEIMTAIEAAKYVVFDTESNGLFDFKQPAEAEGQPRLASACFIFTDEAGNDLGEVLAYVKPDGWSMEDFSERSISAGKKTASEVNGLTDDLLHAKGIPVSCILDLWELVIASGIYPVAHNAQHDCKMIRAELRRAGRDDLFERTLGTCTMRSLKSYKEDGLKVKGWGMINLEEACEFFGIPLTDAHRAESDTEACRTILERLLKDGRLIEPAVHYSKSKEA